MNEPLQKGALICDAYGRKVWATSDKDFVLIQYENAAVARLADQVNRILLEHSLRTAYREPHTSDSFVALNLESVGLLASVRVREGEARVSLVADTGTHLNRQQAEQLRLLSPRQLDCVVDDATHAGRVLRAHLGLAGLELVEALFRFGKLPDQGCIMDAFDPLACRFWDTRLDQAATDYDELVDRLGGEPK